MDATVFLGRENVLADRQIIVVAVNEFEREHGIFNDTASRVSHRAPAIVRLIAIISMLSNDRKHRGAQT